MDCILAVDIGTTSSKALVVSPDGIVAFSAQQGYPTYYPRPGYAEQDPLEIFNAVRKIVKDCCSKHSQSIRAISFSSAMHSLMAVDRNGDPLSKLIIWADTRSAPQASWISQLPNADKIYHASGTPIHPMSPLSKLIWLKENDAGLFQNTARFISIKEFVIEKLTGEYKVDYSVASSGGLFDVHELRWSKEILALVGLDEGRLSACVPAEHCIFLNGEWQKKLSLGSDVVVVMGASDGCLANLGSDAMSPGELSLTIGTSGAVRMASPEYSSDKLRRIFNYRLDSATFITGGATNNGLVLLDWFNKLIGQPAMNIADFAASSATAKPGASGLLFLPFVFGERAPYHNPDMRGVFLGLAQQHTTADMRRALIEGIFYELRSIMECLQEVMMPVQIVLASGGVTRSNTWLQLLANVLNKEVGLRDTNDASALGAALIGFRALGKTTQFAGQTNSGTYYPEKEHRQLYDDMFGTFSRSTNALLPMFTEIVKMQKPSRH